jgi:hypothetical protein
MELSNTARLTASGGIPHVASIQFLNSNCFMIKILRNTLLFTSVFISLTFSLKSTAQTSTSIELKNASLFAGIEVGSKGVKMSVIEVNTKPKQGPTYQIIKDTAINSDFISFSNSSFNATVSALSNLYTKAIQQYEIPSERIFTAISSGVTAQADKENKTAWVQNLADSFRLKIAEPNRQVSLIAVAEEARLSHLGIVPDSRRYSTFLIDIGSGNTKGGYFPYGNTQDFKLFQLNWGTKSTHNAAEKQLEDDKTIQNFSKQLARVLSGAAEKDVVYAVNASGAYNMSDYVAISGGIAWSAATLLYPELQSSTVVPVTYEDVYKLYNIILNKYNSLQDASLLKRADNTDADKAKMIKEIKNVHNVFDQKALLAGTGLLLKIMRQFKGVYDGKEFYLVKNGQVGWISAFVTQQKNQALLNK